MSEKVSVKYKLTLEEYASAQRLHYVRNEFWRVELGAAIMLIYGAGFWALNGHRFFWQILIGIVALLGALLLVRNVVLPILQFRREPKLREECLFTFSDDAIWLKNKYVDSRIEWQTYTKVLENKKVYLLYLAKRMSSIIPKSAFQSAEDEAAFRDLLRRKIAPNLP